MKHKYLILLLLLCGITFSTQAADVTFQVQFTEAPAEGAFIWIPNFGDLWEEMNDDDADLIYTFTVTGIDPGTQLWYTYWTSWEDVEVVPPESRFHDDNSRFFIVPNENYTIPVVGYGENPDPLPEKVNVTFKVELADAVDGMWMVNKNPWQWEEMESIGDDVFEKTWMPFKGQKMYYTFVYGGQDNWEGEESVPEECNYGTPDAPERFFEGAVADSVMPVIPFGGCITSVDFTAITFRVNMSQTTMNAGDIVWTYIFNSDAWPEMTDDDDDNIYITQANFEPGTEILYYYSYGTNDIWDEEVVPAECSDEGGFRTFTVGEEDEELPAYLYGTCDEDPDGIYENQDVFSIYPNPVKDYFQVEMLNSVKTHELYITDISGKQVFRTDAIHNTSFRVSTEDFQAGAYIIHLNTSDGVYHHKILVTK